MAMPNKCMSERFIKIFKICDFLMNWAVFHFDIQAKLLKKKEVCYLKISRTVQCAIGIKSLQPANQAKSLTRRHKMSSDRNLVSHKKWIWIRVTAATSMTPKATRGRRSYCLAETEGIIFFPASTKNTQKAGYWQRIF